MAVGRGDQVGAVEGIEVLVSWFIERHALSDPLNLKYFPIFPFFGGLLNLFPVVVSLLIYPSLFLFGRELFRCHRGQSFLPPELGLFRDSFLVGLAP